MRRLALTAVVLAFFTPAAAAEKTFRADGVVVMYAGIGERYATAIGRTVSAARSIAAQLGFDMPATITVRVTCALDQRVRLFNDGQDEFRLSLRSEKDLRKPAVTGTFHIYGLCHEVGHLAQYRPIRSRGWMTTAAAEGWAHYLGSRLVDAVYAREGEGLWPDAYDYRADGMVRLKRQVASSRRSDSDKGAALWMELAEIVTDRGIPSIFAAWGRAEIDPTDPGLVLGKILVGSPANERLAAWWKKAEPVLVFKRPKSGFAARTISPQSLSGRPAELNQDDGTKAGHRSMAGGGHAVRFQAPGTECYLVGISIHGSRYGRPQATQERFHVWLCDDGFNPIMDFPFPYAAFDRGVVKWVRLPVRPTLVPATFIVCVGFNPTATKGVFVSYDGEGSGNSLSGLPGKGGSPISGGDWMIRAHVDQPKSANALRR